MKISDRIKTVFDSHYKPKKMKAKNENMKITTVSVDKTLWKEARANEINISMATQYGIKALLEVNKVMKEAPPEAPEDEAPKDREEAPAPEELI